MLFLEISAKTGQKVKEAFYTLSESIYNLIPTMSSIDDEIGITPGILQLEGPYEEIPLGKNSEILQGLGPKKLTDSACCVVS